MLFVLSHYVFGYNLAASFTIFIFIFPLCFDRRFYTFFVVIYFIASRLSCVFSQDNLAKHLLMMHFERHKISLSLRLVLTLLVALIAHQSI